VNAPPVRLPWTDIIHARGGPPQAVDKASHFLVPFSLDISAERSFILRILRICVIIDPICAIAHVVRMPTAILPMHTIVLVQYLFVVCEAVVAKFVLAAET